MDVDKKLLADIIYADTYKSLSCFLDRLDLLISHDVGVECSTAATSDLFNKDFFKEVEEFCQSKAFLSFGKTLRDLKCVILDTLYREHVIWIHYNGPNNFCIKDLDLPQTHIQHKQYNSIDEIVNVVQKHVDELSHYIEVMGEIDQCCTVIEPVCPTLRENYRKIYLADKVWLHVEVSPEGSAKNIRVLGQFNERELQVLLQDWDHDKSIASNVLTIKSSLNCDRPQQETEEVTIPHCAICYCVVLPGDTRVPQPLCNNTKCGAYYHTCCLYEWLVTSGGRTAQFGIGKCPMCLQHIQCSDGDIH